MKSKNLKIIKRIQAEAWGKYGDKIFIEEPKAGTMLKVIELSLTEQKDKFTPAQLDKLKNIRDSGMLDGTQKVEDPKIAEKMEKYVAKRIKEEIEAGNLTKPPKKKIEQYAKRKSREEFKKANNK